MHVQQHDIRGGRPHNSDRGVDVARLTDDHDPVGEPEQLAADARPEQRMVVDEDDPNRHARLHGTRSSTSVPWPGADVQDGSATEAVDASDDRLADAAPIVGDGGRVEALAGVTDEAGRLGVVGLDEHVDTLDLGVPGGVDDGLADGGDEAA